MKAIVLDPLERRRHLVQTVLLECGHQVTTVSSVEELLAARRSGGHQLVFVAADILRDRGLPLSQQLRIPGEEGSCLILALECDRVADPRELLAAGADDVLAGPLEAESLALRTAIAEHHLQRALRRDRWFETLIALGNTVYTVTDVHGTILYTSPSLTSLSGIPLGDVVGKSVFDLVVPEDLERVRRLFAEVASKPGETLRALLRCWNGRGAQSVVEASVRNGLEDPLIGGLIITSTDVTRQRQMESALESSQTRYRTLVETAREGIAICDADEKLTFVNPAFAEQLGFPRDEMTGMNLRELTDAAEFARLQRETAARRLGTANRYEVRLFTKQGSLRVLAVSAAPLFSETGEFLGTLGVTTDITDRRREAERLRKSEERYRLIAENVSDVIWSRHLPEPVPVPALADLAAAEAFAEEILGGLEATYVSPSVTRMLGYSVSEALMYSVRDVLVPASYARLRKAVASAALNHQSGQPGSMTVELQYLTRDGGTRWGELTGTFLWDDQCRIVGSLVVTRDITERKQVEEALLGSELRLRRLIENMPDFVILVDENARICYVNRAAANRQPQEMLGHDGFGFLVEASREACRQLFATALKTGDVQFVEVQGVSGLWWSCRLVPLKEQTGTSHVMIICTDVTEEKRVGEALQDEQDLLRRLIELHERDRKVLAFELHDGFAQQLTGAMMSLEAAARLISSAPEKAAASLKDSMRLLRDSVDESRRLVSGLCPPVLDQFGIVPAVEHLVGLNHCGEQLEIEFVTRGRSQRLASPIENAVFRIVQETLTNIRRHSGSRKAVVELRFDDQTVSVQVRDWGSGFDPGSVREACFGLRGIRERARLLGGQAEIVSSPGGGTVVQVSLPMIEPAPDSGNRGEWDWG